MKADNHGDLSFFGAVTASISHEIKNRMAIINEQAGLLEDLVNMSERGRPIEPERLMRIAGNVQDQVARADRIIKSMNRFAHSVDTFWYTADLAEMLDLIASLCRRRAEMHGCELVVPGENDSVSATTCPFSLVHLFWETLEILMPGAAKGKIITLGCQSHSERVSVWIGADLHPEAFEEVADNATIESLIMALKGKPVVDTRNQRIVFELPAKP